MPKQISSLFLAAFLTLMLPVAGLAQGTPQDLIPDRRILLSENTDLPGGDIAQVFDTTLEACERACLANPQCQALTFNARNGSCFPKGAAGQTTPFTGAYSAVLVQSDAAVRAQAPERRAELGFLTDGDIAQARLQAGQMGRDHLTNGLTAAELLPPAA